MRTRTRCAGTSSRGSSCCRRARSASPVHAGAAVPAADPCSRDARTARGARLEFYYHELDSSVLILRADGGINADNAGQFVTDLEKIVDAGLRKIIVDCSGLDHISSFGIGVLLRVHKQLARHG